MTDLTAFWDEQHRLNHRLYLTGSPLSHYRAHAGVDRLAVTRYPQHVMEIGIGYGTFVSQVLAWGHKVTAVDISYRALTRVAGMDAETFLTKDLPEVEADSIDLVVCHLVLQHCEDEMVQFLLEQAVRVLKPKTGIGSFQFASRIPGLMPAWLQAGVDLGVLFWRTPEQMLAWAEAAGAVEPVLSNLIEFPNQSAVGWYILSFVAP